MLSICIVTKNNAPVLGHCLQSLARTMAHSNQIVIYDNDSSDDTEAVVQRFVGLYYKGMMSQLLSYRKGPDLGQYGALDDCYGRCKYEWTIRIHTDHMAANAGWDHYLERAIKRTAHPYKWLLCARSIEPVKGHTSYHLIENWGRDPESFSLRKEEMYAKYATHQDYSLVTGYREPFVMSLRLYEKFDKESMLKYYAYCGDDETVMQAYHLGARQFWMVNGALCYHMMGTKGGQTNSAQTVDKDKDWPYEMFVKEWRAKGYKDAGHPGQFLPSLIPEYIRV